MMKKYFGYLFVFSIIATVAIQGTGFGFDFYATSPTNPGVNCSQCHDDGRVWTAPASVSSPCTISAAGRIHIPALDLGGSFWVVDLDMLPASQQLQWVLSGVNPAAPGSFSPLQVATFTPDGLLHMPELDLSQLGANVVVPVSLRLVNASPITFAFISP